MTHQTAWCPWSGGAERGPPHHLRATSSAIRRLLLHVNSFTTLLGHSLSGFAAASCGGVLTSSRAQGASQSTTPAASRQACGPKPRKRTGHGEAAAAGQLLEALAGQLQRAPPPPHDAGLAEGPPHLWDRAVLQDRGRHLFGTGDETAVGGRATGMQRQGGPGLQDTGMARWCGAAAAAQRRWSPLHLQAPQPCCQ